VSVDIGIQSLLLAGETRAVVGDEVPAMGARIHPPLPFYERAAFGRLTALSHIRPLCGEAAMLTVATETEIKASLAPTNQGGLPPAEPTRLMCSRPGRL
jgi:hypothetical protein